MNEQLAVDARTAPYAAFTLRVGLGVVFVAHALMKLLVFTLPGTGAFFDAHGFPAWTAYPVFAMELAGGTALLLGVGTRWVALALLPVLAGALTVHWSNGWAFTAPEGGWEYVAFLMAALLAQAGLGDGAFALRTGLTSSGRSSAPPRTAPPASRGAAEAHPTPSRAARPAA